MKYAYVSKDLIVENIIVCEDADFNKMAMYLQTPNMTGMWIKITEGSGRARIGGLYNPEKAKFYDAQPFPSWKLNPKTLEWYAPVNEPEGKHFWDEDLQKWVELIVNDCPECMID